MDLNDVTFVVVDTETTGTRPGHNRVIEIGAAKVVNGRIVEKYQQLINPGTAIPYQITRLTGITNSLVYSEPAVGAVLDDFLEFLRRWRLRSSQCPIRQTIYQRRIAPGRTPTNAQQNTVLRQASEATPFGSEVERAKCTSGFLFNPNCKSP